MSERIRPQPPAHRRLRIFAFDPSLELDLDTAVINQAVVKIPWECDPDTGENALAPGPVGEYVEVIDADPASGCFYAPADLNDPHLLAQDGFAPSEGDPRFHQQMVYAVAMRTIRNFEIALGRLALWSPRRGPTAAGTNRQQDEYIGRLRIYPHALREANAYYSPALKALLFGYFPATPRDRREHLPHGMVFTCLSHDVVAHETTHALLDGLHRRYLEPSNPDVLAFHEGFADVVAIFQHFTFPEVLRHEIARTSGDLSGETLLTELAIQFGYATARGGALRSALDGKEPDAAAIDHVDEPHARGAILVAAVFDAFLTIYKARIADLLRLATGGTGKLQEGAIHPDLVNRLADEAAKAAQHVLTMCIRALDYCPPVDITFGDYLRALITADAELVADDDRGYRIAFVSAFRRRGIYPRDVRTLSEESLRWRKPDGREQEILRQLLPDVSVIRQIVDSYTYTPLTMPDLETYVPLDEVSAEGEIREVEQRFLQAETSLRGEGIEPTPELRAAGQASPEGRVAYRVQVKSATGVTPQRASSNREALYYRTRDLARMLHFILKARRQKMTRLAETDISRITGLDLVSEGKKFEVHAVRPAKRVGPDGQALTHLVIVITQRETVAPREREEELAAQGWEVAERSFYFRGGCTLIVDPETGGVRYCIAKDINDQARRDRQFEYLHQAARVSGLVRALGLGTGAAARLHEPLAMIHRWYEDKKQEWS
jgi:hypothetical protein